METADRESGCWPIRTRARDGAAILVLAVLLMVPGVIRPQEIIESPYPSRPDLLLPSNLDPTLRDLVIDLYTSGDPRSQDVRRHRFETDPDELTVLAGRLSRDFELDAEKTVCVVEKSVEYHPGEADYAHAIWVLHYADGSPVEEEKEVHFATLIWLPNPPAPGMPPVDATYFEKVGEDGRVVFDSPADWSDRRMAITVDKLIDDTIQYVGDGDELIIEADR